MCGAILSHRHPKSMDPLSKTLNTYLVAMAYEGATHEQEHQMEHLLDILEPADEQMLISYYGLFGEPRHSLADIAAMRHQSPEDALAAIERSIRKIAVTPEWQTIKG